MVSYSGHRFLVFLFLALSPAIAVFAPRERRDLNANPDENSTAPVFMTGSKLSISEKPFWMKRNFAQGQPELQQAMDNMLIREQMIKRNIQFPPVDVDGYPALLTHKTAYLLAEAEHMLNRVKNFRERRWVEAFVHRLKLLASLLEKSVATEAPAENKGLNISTRGNVQSLGRTLGAENHLPVTPSSTPASLAPDLNQENAAQEPSKTPVNSSQVKEVSQPNQDDGQAKSGLIQQLRNKKLDEDDELVRELENLHNVVALENPPQNSIPPLTTTGSASTVPPKRMFPVLENGMNIEMEKEKIKKILIHEAEALQRLGGTPEEIMSTLQLDEGFVGYKDPESSFNQNPISIETETNSFGNPNTEIKDVHSEESMISKTNKHVWRPSTLVHPASHPSKDIYMNRSFQGMHMNLPPMNQQMLSRQLQNGPKNLPHAALHLPHYNGIKNTIQKLQGPDYQFNNHIVHDQQALQNDQHGIPAPMEVKQNHFLQNDGKNNFNPSLSLYRPGPGNKHGYSPYPYFPNINHKNSTMYGTQIYPSYNKNNNFSDEMKRQLRDGKVILLSDSVVRSNFEQTPDKDKNENGKTEAPAEIAKAEGKNETQAQN